jgi:hypothetical protein
MKKFYRTSLGFSWVSRLKRIFKRSEPLIVATESKYFRDKNFPNLLNIGFFVFILCLFAMVGKRGGGDRAKKEKGP